MHPTPQTYDELQIAYDHFNVGLFDARLPQCLITLQREKRVCGYFSSERFIDGQGVRTDEIALNPAYFAISPLQEIMQTLVHEMVHAWQQHFGKPSRRSYHNKEWSDLMESIGLMPSDTGKEGGKRVGQKMADYVIEGGRFLNSFESLRSKAFNLTWRDRYPVREQIQQLHNGAIEALTPEAMAEAGIVVALPKSIPTREKFMCPKCAASAWGKPSLNLVCGDCSTAFKKV